MHPPSPTLILLQALWIGGIWCEQQLQISTPPQNIFLQTQKSFSLLQHIARVFSPQFSSLAQSVAFCELKEPKEPPWLKFDASKLTQWHRISAEIGKTPVWGFPEIWI